MASSDRDASRLYIDENEAGSRLDRMLLRRLGQPMRPLIQRLIRRGNVRINGKRVKPDQRLEQGDCVFLPASLRQPQSNERKARHASRFIPATEFPVLYEDEQILAVNKPAGMVVHAGSGYGYGLIEQMKQARGLADLRLAHRLDRDTSGCLLLAKTLPALRRLGAAFREQRAHKTYLAWVAGHPYPYAGRMRSSLSKGVLRGGERMVVRTNEGKQAVTDYQVILLARYDDWPFALLALQPESGRTHQLRVQLQHEGHAILGDGKYGQRADNRLFRDAGGKGMALHAWRLRVPHPVSGMTLELKAPWPEHWSACFANVRQHLYPGSVEND